jgi:enoyl-CoA hydratase/carnithine racemase
VKYETLLVEVTGGVASVTLNRPEVRNALNTTMVRELEDALQKLETDPEARVVVLAGAGDKAFCAGADLKDVGDRGTTLQARESFGGLARILEGMARMKTPVIARVHGYALAGGCGLAAGCDIVVAAEEAIFGLPEIKIGLLPFIVMAPILRSVGRKRGMLMILTGEQVSAREPTRWGW